MIPNNYYAILGMFAVVITLYALRDSHHYFLPDFFGLAFALTAARPSMAVGAVVIVAIIRHTPLARGLADITPEWLYPLLLPAAYHMSIAERESAELESAYSDRISPAESNEGNTEECRRVAGNQAETIISARVDLAVTAIESGMLGRTEATQIAAGRKSGREYTKYKRMIDLEIERRRNHYPPTSNLKRFN